MFRCAVVLLLLSPYVVFAQRGNPRMATDVQDLFLKDGFFSLNMGVSQPFGEYAAHDYKDDYDFLGYANTGYHLDATFGYGIIPPLGFVVQYTFNENLIDDEARGDVLQKNNSPYQVKFESGARQLSGFMYGFYYSLRTMRSNTDLRLMIGYLNGTSPDNYIYVAPAQNPSSPRDSLFIASRSGRGWGYSAGVHMRYKLISDLQLTIGAEVIACDVVLRERYVYWQNIQGLLILDNLTQPFRLANFSVGLAWQFE
jgi:hypothetical protein